MNLSLLDPFALAQEFPDTQATTLHLGHATCLKFSPNGDYLASGLINGSIAIFDLDTNGVLTVLQGHSRQIESLSWSHTNRYLLSAGRDWKCIIWDLGVRGNVSAIQKIKVVVNLGAPVWMAQFHPKNDNLFVASLLDKNAVFVDISQKNIGGDVIPHILDLNSSIKQQEPEQEPEPELEREPEEEQEPGPGPEPEPEEDTKKRKGKRKRTKKGKGSSSKKKTGSVKQDVLTAMFSPSGEYIITGTSRGSINIIRTGSPEVMYSKSISTSKIKSMALSPSGRLMVVNSSDRVIRLLAMPDMRYPPPDQNGNHKNNESGEGFSKDNDDGQEFANIQEWDIKTQHKFQDVVNRLQWNSVAIAPSAEYIIASTFEDAQDIYMWDTSTGSLVKIYNGPKEELVEIAWHPTRPLIAATGLESGRIHTWTSVPPQRWSALAPDFIEVDENVVYDEAEDEFDRLYEDIDAGEEQDEEDESVDVFGGLGTIPGVAESTMFVIPVSMEFEDDEKPVSEDD
ncbi:uncharacterized protein SAPINGB_P001068 [Magnusiomyces paraingens]|uniref:Anaphase-promoting complex subunit 4 WD40 domain-containing protein n=1 Tax=Magnusiomyces paraingens TaxID=2606893 RepID=A0A5E8B5P7_9ASCO|nr:uncharacterized protein SAPINGB_P001068 [Saprochaete ingens]VVT46144.1 unnamed protein product [Saprochaete ingens]